MLSRVRPLRPAADDALAIVRARITARDLSETVFAGDTAELTDALRGGTPALVVLDVSSASDAVAEVAAIRTIAGMPARILAVGSVNDVQLYRSLIGAGVADYLPLPHSADDIDATLDRLLASAPVAAPHVGGRAVAVVGTRGGVGVTTAAITLGWLLAEEMSQRTALLDLDLHFGTVALSLDIDPGRGLKDALEKPERIDGLYIDRASVKVGANLYALSAEEPIEDVAAYDPDAAGQLIRELKQKFDWIIVDLPRGAGTLTRTVLTETSHIIIVADSTLAGLRDAIRLQSLARACNPDQRVIVLKGGALGGRGGVGRAEFERELGRPLDGAIPSDPKAAMDAANAGQPLPQTARQSPAVVAMRQIATKLGGAASPSRKFRLIPRFGRS